MNVEIHKSQLQAAFDAIDRHDAEPLDRAKARGLMRGYDFRWSRDVHAIESVEQVLTSALPNIDSNKFSRTFRLAGKLDVIATKDGKRILIDHKTTSQDISDPNSPFWRQLTIDSQPSLYYLLAHLNGIKIDGIIWDAIRKPGIAPKALTKAEQVSITSSQRYFGGRVSFPCLEKIGSGFGRETEGLYELRLAHECTEHLERYFARMPVPRLDTDITEYAREVWHLSQEILRARRSNEWTRNPGACLQYNTPCEYLGVCSGYDRLNSEKWAKVDSVHNELGDSVDGSHLTHSRLRCFQMCRKKHFYRYEIGARRVDDAASDSLRFGSLMHVALEAWWLAFGETKHGNNGNSTAIEAGQSVGPQLAGGVIDGR